MSMGLQELLPLLGAAVVVFLFFRRGGAGGGYIAAGLVIDEYEFSDQPDKLVTIKAHQGGFIGFVFNLIGLAAIYKIIVTQREVRVSVTGKFSDNEISVPISAIGGIFYGYTRPMISLIIGGCLVVGSIFGLLTGSLGFVPAVVVFLIGAAILYFIYWLNKTIEVRVASEGVFWGYNFYQGDKGTIGNDRKTYSRINRLVYYNVRGQRGAEADSLSDPVIELAS